jgi:hypothetical protein
VQANLQVMPELKGARDAMDFDAGSESRTQIGWVIVGGLLLVVCVVNKVTNPEEEPLALPAGGPKERPMPAAD